VESIHPFACLILLPNAEEVSIAWQNFEEEEWPLPPRPHLTSLSFRCSVPINFSQFKTLFAVFPNVEDLELDLGGVTGFDEMVTDF
jgi:hypothetical protein